MRLANWLGSCEEQFVADARAERTDERTRWRLLCEELLNAGQKGTLEKAGKQFKTECSDFLKLLRNFLAAAEKKPARAGARMTCAGRCSLTV